MYVLCRNLDVGMEKNLDVIQSINKTFLKACESFVTEFEEEVVKYFFETKEDAAATASNVAGNVLCTHVNGKPPRTPSSSSYT